MKIALLETRPLGRELNLPLLQLAPSGAHSLPLIIPGGPAGPTKVCMDNGHFLQGSVVC